jgi:hypothetical protein
MNGSGKMYRCVSLKKSEKLMPRIDLIETVCDSSYKIGEIRTTATHIHADRLMGKYFKMFMNRSAAKIGGALRPSLPVFGASCLLMHRG